MELLTQLGINWQLLIAQIVNFLIVLGVLTALVYKPLLNLLEQRAERIRKAMDEAKRLEEQALRMEETRRTELKKIDQECGAILAEARKKAEAVHVEMLEKARTEALAILSKGRQELEQEKAQALHQVQDVLGLAVVRLTEQLLEREFSPADQKKAVASLSASIPTLLR